MSNIVRLYVFTKAYYDCLETYYGSPLLASGDHPLSRAFVRIRLVVEELLLDEEYHPLGSAYPSQFQALSPNDPDYPEADWELGGQQEAYKFLVRVQELYIKAGEPALMVTEADKRILDEAYSCMQEYTERAQRRWKTMLKRGEATREQHKASQADTGSQSPLPNPAQSAPVYITQIQSVSNSQLQVGTVNSTQSGTLGGNGGIEGLREFLKVFREQLPQLGLRAADLEESEAEIATLEAQAKSNRPKPKIIVESLKTLRNVIEGTTGSLVASGLLTLVTDLIGRFGG